MIVECCDIVNHRQYCLPFSGNYWMHLKKIREVIASNFKVCERPIGHSMYSPSNCFLQFQNDCCPWYIVIFQYQHKDNLRLTVAYGIFRTESWIIWQVALKQSSDLDTSGSNDLGKAKAYRPRYTVVTLCYCLTSVLKCQQMENIPLQQNKHCPGDSYITLLQ
jgi:hypothetical protein